VLLGLSGSSETASNRLSSQRVLDDVRYLWEAVDFFYPHDQSTRKRIKRPRNALRGAALGFESFTGKKAPHSRKR
jgi:hypothetical protein